MTLFTQLCVKLMLSLAELYDTHFKLGSMLAVYFRLAAKKQFTEFIVQGLDLYINFLPLHVPSFLLYIYWESTEQNGHTTPSEVLQ